MVGASSLRGLVLVCSLLSLALADEFFDAEESSPKKIKCAQGSLHDWKPVEIEEEKTLGCRLTLIYDEYLIVRMVYYDYHRMGVESNMAMDCDEDGFISVICDGEEMCNVKIAEGLTKGALDTVARNYYLQCLYHKSIQRGKFYVDDVLKGTIWTIMLIVLACLSLQIVRKYKQAQRQKTIDLVQAYDRKKEYKDKMDEKQKEREKREAAEQQANNVPQEPQKQ